MNQLIQGGIYKEKIDIYRNDNKYFVIVLIKNETLYGYDIIFNTKYSVMSQSMILNQLQLNLELRFLDSNFWKLSRSVTNELVDGYLGKISQKVRIDLEAALLNSDCWNEKEYW